MPRKPARKELDQRVKSPAEASQNRTNPNTISGNDEWLKNIYNQSPIAIELYDDQGMLMDINSACCELFGVESADAVRGFRLFDDPSIPAERTSAANLDREQHSASTCRSPGKIFRKSMFPFPSRHTWAKENPF